MSRPVNDRRFKGIADAFEGMVEATRKGYMAYLVFYHLRIEIAVMRTSVKVLDEDMDVILIRKVVVEKSWRRKGCFKTMLQIIENYALKKKACVYVEAISNPILKDYLIRIGYEKDPTYESDPCYWYSPEEERDLFCLV